MKCKKQTKTKQKQTTSLPFLDSFNGFPSRNRSATKLSLLRTGQFMITPPPLYLSDLLQKHNPSRLLRSASRSLLDVPGPRDSKTKRYGKRAFRYVAPSLWNVLSREHQGEGLHSVFQTFGEKPISLPRDDSQCECVRAPALVYVLSGDDVAIITLCVCGGGGCLCLCVCDSFSCYHYL